MRVVFFILLISISTSYYSKANDCGPVPPGTLLDAGCRIIPTPVPSNVKTPDELEKFSRWELIQIGAYSGKPGYYVIVDPKSQLHLDAVIMDNSLRSQFEKMFSNANLGEVRTCQIKGFQQPTVYTIFKIKNCHK